MAPTPHLPGTFVRGPRRGSSAPASPTVTKLPAIVLERASQRLGMVSLCCVLAFVVSFPVMNYSASAVGADLTVANWVATACVALSLLVFAVTRFSKLGARRLVDLGLVYEVFLGLGLALAEIFATYDPYSTIRGVSWICLWITVFPLIVPSTPGKTLIVAVATATAGPVALGVALLLGQPAPSVATALLMFLPNYFAVGLALVLSRSLYQLRADVNRERQLGSYQLVELLGRGGMGEVWRARHRMLARPAAIKLVSPDALAGRSGADVDTIMRRFAREAEATAHLTSIHTIQVFDFGVTGDGTLYYVMELLDGVDLETLVQEHGPVSPERVVHLLAQACESLAEAHDGGLVHRDVKPANLYVCRLGTTQDCVKILDFGLVGVTAALESGRNRLTADGQVTGTPAYMAPEVIRGDREPDERIDVYALGCVAYFLLTGKLVFEATTPLQMVYGHVEQAPELPSRRLGAALPKDLERLVMDCLAKDPDDRPSSAAELRARILACDVAPWTAADAAAWWSERPEPGVAIGAVDAIADTHGL